MLPDASDIGQVLLDLQQDLQERSRASLAFFCRHLLGYTDMNAEHEALCEFLQHNPAHTKLILMPRYTFKSSIVTIGHSLWLLLNNPNERILIASDAAEKAEGFLSGIKHHLLGASSSTSFFRTLCGAWEVDPKQGVWNQSAIVIAPRTRAGVEPSIDTAGLETSKVGKHYSRIKFDDVVTDKNITTKDLMDKVEGVVKKSGSLLDPSGSTDLAGTRWHFGDAYGRLKAERHGDPAFAIFHRKAFDGTHYFFNDIGKNSLTKDFLDRKRVEQGTRLFSCLYQNEPVDDETATFKQKDFQFYVRPNNLTQWKEGLYITCVLDPIPPPTSDHGDDAAITVVGTDHEHAMYLLEAVAGRLTTEQQLETVFALHATWGFRVFGLETNAFQRVLKSAFERRLQELRLHPDYQPFSIVEFTGVTQGNKEQRIQGLQPWHEQGLIRLPGERFETLTAPYSTLAYQMLEFPHSQHDDLLDSLAYHLKLKQVGSIPIAEPVVPYGSAIWFERQWRQQQVLERRRQPRWKRQPLPEWTFA